LGGRGHPGVLAPSPARIPRHIRAQPSVCSRWVYPTRRVELPSSEDYPENLRASEDRTEVHETGSDQQKWSGAPRFDLGS
jgi:hypothetical protein